MSVGVKWIVQVCIPTLFPDCLISLFLVWLAPEVMQSQPYTVKADVYGAGVIFWEIVTRQNFFGETSFLSVIEEKVLRGERPPIPSDCLPAYAALISDMWHQDAEKRSLKTSSRNC